ncbi:hypothetical protein PENDEC_c001G00103 [Penicillium decumbens]|uniref:Uncharacterized protein n=1 Tax=Penicillium decumbens TaxID=69771 RepID=A0A1V6PML4_PENDC|nr:hypothetical protein PENDEC_c001G00103 [Penicillium decumbens]
MAESPNQEPPPAKKARKDPPPPKTDMAVYLVSKAQKVRGINYPADSNQVGDVMVDRTPLNLAPVFEVYRLYFFAVYRDYYILGGNRLKNAPADWIIGKVQALPESIDAAGIIRTYNNPQYTSVITRRQPTEGTAGATDTDDLVASEIEGRYDAIPFHHKDYVLTYANSRRQLVPL